ncbi:putative SP-containing membrane protein [Vairimorpha necatrix]|uniref:SP-containing membrane protein n=1 Tax=Vairimorpha necatrix TaxID=6039 RepID=A0AAX4JFL8_9MICR
MIKKIFAISITLFSFLKCTIYTREQNNQIITNYDNTYLSNFPEKNDIETPRYSVFSDTGLDNTIEKTIHSSKLTPDYNLQNEDNEIISTYEELNNKYIKDIDFTQLKNVCDKLLQLFNERIEFYDRMRKISPFNKNSYLSLEEMGDIFYESVRNYACSEELHPYAKSKCHKFFRKFVSESAELIFMLSSKKFQKLFLTPYEYKHLWSDIDKCIDLQYSANEKDKIENVYNGIKYKKIVAKLHKLVDDFDDKFYYTNDAKKHKPNFKKLIYVAASGLSLLNYICPSLNEYNILPSEKNVKYDLYNEVQPSSRYSSIINDNFYEIIYNSKYDNNRETELPIEFQDEIFDNSNNADKNNYGTTESEVKSTSSTIVNSGYTTTQKEDLSTTTIKNIDEETTTEIHSPIETSNSSYDKTTTEVNMTTLKYDTTVSSTASIPYENTNNTNSDNPNNDVTTMTSNTITTETNTIDKNAKNYNEEKDRYNAQFDGNYMPYPNYNNEYPPNTPGSNGPGLVSKVIGGIGDVVSGATGVLEDIAVEGGGALVKKGIGKFTGRINNGIKIGKGIIEGLDTASDVASGIGSSIKNSNVLQPHKGGAGNNNQKTHGNNNDSNKSKKRKDEDKNKNKKPKDEKDFTTKRPKDENKNTTEKPKDEKDFTTKKPKDEDKNTTEKPKDGKKSTTEKPKDEKDSTTKKPKDEKEITTKKPKDENKNTNEKPKDEKDSTTKKPKDEKEITTKKPKDENKNTNEKPKDEKEITTKKPKDEKEITTKKPKDGNKNKKNKLENVKNKLEDSLNAIGGFFKLYWKLLSAVFSCIFFIVSLLCCFGKTLIKCCRRRKKNYDEEKQILIDKN